MHTLMPSSLKNQNPSGCSNVEIVTKEFAALLRKWREMNEIKISVAASELGVSTATWGHWEEARRFPNLDNLLLLSKYTEIPVQHFLCPNRSRCPFNSEHIRCFYSK